MKKTLIEAGVLACLVLTVGFYFPMGLPKEWDVGPNGTPILLKPTAKPCGKEFVFDSDADLGACDKH